MDLQTVLNKYDDLETLSAGQTANDGFTLVSVVHDEMYYLPAFLTHYRRLGVQRFVFIDDCSVDGWTAFLAAQSDVLVPKSGYRFGDVIQGDDARPFHKRKVKMNTIWRQILLRKFAMDRWALCVDVDEFIDLPEGMAFPDLAKVNEEADARVVWAVMLDMYPRSIDDLVVLSREPHLAPSPDGPPVELYAGSRARLLHNHGLNHRAKWLRRHWARLTNQPPLHYNTLQKPSLLKWHSNAVLTSPHVVKNLSSSKMLLPMRHYRFTGETYRRISWALKSGGYAGNSIEYKTLSNLLAKMKASNGLFGYDLTCQHCSFDDFARTGNAIGLN